MELAIENDIRASEGGCRLSAITSKRSEGRVSRIECVGFVVVDDQTKGPDGPDRCVVRSDERSVARISGVNREWKLTTRAGQLLAASEPLSESDDEPPQISVKGKERKRQSRGGGDCT